MADEDGKVNSKSIKASMFSFVGNILFMSPHVSRLQSDTLKNMIKLKRIRIFKYFTRPCKCTVNNHINYSLESIEQNNKWI
jgi:hypothetical protein